MSQNPETIDAHEGREISIEEEMDLAHESVKKTPGPSSVTKSISKKSLKKQFEMFELDSVRTPNLDALFDALLTIKPSSVESERHGIVQSI